MMDWLVMLTAADIEQEPVTEIRPASESSDPIDDLVYEFIEAVAKDRLPAAAVQRRTIEGVQAGDPEAARRLVRTNRGLIATLAFFHRTPDSKSAALLREGGRALVRAAGTYDPNKAHFEDHAVMTIREALVERFPHAGNGNGLPDSDFPMQGVLHAAVELRERGLRQGGDELSPASPADTEHEPEVLHPFTPFQRKVLRRLHLPNKDIASNLKCPCHVVEGALGKVFDQTPFDTRIPLALHLQASGLRYALVEPARPLDELLETWELEVARSLERTNGEIGADKNMSDSQMANAIGKIRRETGARSRTELALMVQRFDLRSGSA